MPHPTTYPWQWLWDSCFHAVAWAHLGDERGATELAAALSDIDADGFVPHVRYPAEPDFHAAFWGRSATSSITQPPMYGHAVSELVALGFDVPEETVDRATRGLRFLLRRRARTDDGLVLSCHPWETGCDDNPRWDHWRPDPGVADWRERKGTLLASVERTPGGAPLANPAFRSAPVGFNALIVFNARELAGVTGDEGLATESAELAEAIDGRWDGTTWVDAGDGSGSSGRLPTLDGLLPALLDGPHTTAALGQILDPDSFGAPFGPAAVSRSSPLYDPDTYWRGPAWPQLSYLCWLAATRSRSAGAGAVAESVAESVAGTTVAGAVTSGWAEYWNPETGAGRGAVPQSWTSLAAVLVSDRREPRRA